MSLFDARNEGPPALGWTDIRLRKLAIDDDLDIGGNTQIDGDVNIDGTLTANNINPGGIAPGAPNTFLHTNNLNNVVWQPFSAGNITGGNDYDILTKD